MRIYLAARYSRRLEMLDHAKTLLAAGHVVTSRWVFGAHDTAIPDEDLHLPEHRSVAAAFALEDMVDVQEAELLLAFTEPPAAFVGRGGRHVEMGLALDMKKHVWIVGPMENIFYTLGHVQQFADFADVLKVLDHRRVTG